MHLTLGRHPYRDSSETIICNYEGETLNGVPHGIGKITHRTVDAAPSYNIFGSAIGNLISSLIKKRNRAHNEEAKNYLDFEGYSTFKMGAMEGMAWLTTGTGELLTGEIKDNRFTGLASEYSADTGSLRYRGEFSNSEWCGKGRATLAD